MGAMKMETKKGTRELIGQMTGDSQQSIFLIIMKTMASMASLTQHISRVSCV